MAWPVGVCHMSSFAESAPVIRFGSCACDLRSGELRRQGRTVRLTEQSRLLLVALLEKPGELVTRKELEERLWPGQDFGDFSDGLNTAINKLRLALKDSASHPRYIETFPRRGYRFIAQIENEAAPEPPRPFPPRGVTTAPVAIAAAVVGAAGPLPGGAAVTEPASGSDRTQPAELAARPAAAHAAIAWPAPVYPPQPASTRTAPQTVSDASRGAGREESWGESAAAWQAGRSRRRGLELAVTGFAAAAGLFAVWWFNPAPAPRVTGVERITFSGKVDTPVKPVSDGSGVYYIARNGDHWDLMQTAPGKGDGNRILAPVNSALVMDASPAGLMLGTFIRRGDEVQLWSAPTANAAATRLGNIHADAAAYSPDGKHIAYVHEHALWIVDADGANARKLTDLAAPAGWLAWSPDGRRLRFTFGALFGSAANSIWEESSQGGSPRQILPGRSQAESDCCGTWTADGRYFIFTSNRGGGMNLWALREEGSGLRRHPAGPFQLTAGPDMPFGGIPSVDGQRVFFYNGDFRNELERLDAKTAQWTPLLTGASAMHVSYSHDGGSMAFIDTQNHALFRSRADGAGERMELAPASLIPVFPRWSPDGRWVMFSGRAPDHTMQVFVVATEGGQPEPLLPGGAGLRDADWSGDGQRVVLVQNMAGTDESEELLLVDFATRRAQAIPGSGHMSASRWSPNGRYISATSDDQTQLKLWDVATGQWRTIATGAALGIALWSPDSRYLYYQDLLGPGEAVWRYEVARGRIGRVADFSEVLHAGVSRCALVGITPDGSPIVGFNRSALDLYAARVTWP